ncbi:RusA family crossover junction endodeoxyribonuclease [Streptococcus jiangjianxini]|uniref:RusA family crossover junction endodeoxyribonuclease n=1 Tax=Streptococcus jiangjianxini TaxID=3161189 RepID=UPI0032EEFF9D
MTKLTIPIEPKPQSRPRFSKWGTYEDPKMKAWREKCSNLLAEELLLYPVDDKKAYKMDIVFYIEPPKYIAKVKKNQPLLENETMPVSKKPDTDNYIKALLDSWSGFIFKDDGQVSDISARKRYSYNPRIEVEIEEMGQKNDNNAH